MNRIALVSSLALLLSACSGDFLTAKKEETVVVASGAAVEVRAAENHGQLEFQLNSGIYQCEQGLKVHVQRDPGDTRHIRIGWTNNEYQLSRDDSSSGLPRYENIPSGLVWIDLPWKSVLLDGRKNKPLASECVLAAAK